MTEGMKTLATIFQVKPAAELRAANQGEYPFSFEDKPELPFRACCPCPFTGEHVEAAGDSVQGALYALGQALRFREMQFVVGKVEQAEVSL